MIIADIFEVVRQAMPAGLVMLAMGVLFAVILLVASIKLHVQVDPRVEEVFDVLPHLDCGACGYPGCMGYAKAVIKDPGGLIGKCSPGGAKTSDAIGRVLNLQISGGGAPARPIIHCRAHNDDRTYYAPYSGIDKCIAANAYASGMACRFGCLGFGDCVAACKFDALHVIDGLATVDYEKCTGCGACSRACPRFLIEMIPFAHENMMTVACRNREVGKVTRGMCKVGCIACGICVKQSELFTVADGFAKLNSAAYEPSEKTETAAAKCPTGVIVYRGKTAPAPREAGQKV